MNYCLLDKIVSTEEVYWTNPQYQPFEQAIKKVLLTGEDVHVIEYQSDYSKAVEGKSPLFIRQKQFLVMPVQKLGAQHKQISYDFYPAYIA